MRLHWLLPLLILPIAAHATGTQNKDLDAEGVIVRLHNSAYEGQDLARYAHSHGALRDARRQAEMGHVNSMYNLAVMYHVRGNHKQAMHWYQRAASRKHAIAAYNLGSMHYNGVGTEVDRDKAAKWIRKAARLGLPEAQFHLGNLHYRGHGVPQDHAQEMQWYLKAAESGMPEAQYNLAVLYANGEGVAKDEVKAREWLQRAHENGFEAADEQPRIASSIEGGLSAVND